MNKIINNRITVGGVEYTLLFDGLVPPITDEEYQNLKRDINESGVMVPVITDENRGIIDGFNRLTVASELNLKTVPIQIHPSLSKQEKKELAIRLNAVRRQLSKEDRLEMAVSLRKDKYSYRRIGEILNMNHETVRRHLLALGDSQEFPEAIIGKDGVEKPAKGKRKPCVVIKNSGEAKNAFELFSNSKKVDLSGKVMDLKGLKRQIRMRKPAGDGPLVDVRIGKADLKLGFFEEKGEEIPSESVDMIITDPPYSQKALPLWDSLGKFAQRTLKPGGILLSYSGNMFLPEIHTMLGKYLQYFWTFAVRHTGGNTFVRNLQIQQTYKPVVAYCKPPLEVSWHPFLDMVSGGRSKSNHEWEQPVEEASYFIKNMCPKNGRICDPMMGSGTNIVAAISQGMEAIGIDQDTDAYVTAQERVAEIEQETTKKAA
jgi:16S rRNA G966 N2-methylase RsmD